MRNDLDLGAVHRIQCEIGALRPDLVHLHTGRATWLGGLASLLSGLPAITTRRMDRTVPRSLRTRLIYGSLVTRVVAISMAVRDALIAGGVDPGKISVIHDAVDPCTLVPCVEREARKRVRRRLEVSEGTMVILSLASLVRRKGLDVLLEALYLVTTLEPDRDVALWIAGEGPERRALEAQSERLGLLDRVRLLGQRTDVADLLSACDVFALPSRREGMGVAALEAMAARRPVVASRVGGLSECVADGQTGLLVEPEDARALASALLRLAREPDTRRRLGDAGPGRLADGFLSEHMVAAYERVYRAALSERSCA